jgi:1,4-dihydroxy-2-naphthoate polyprenyltransferase
LKVLLFGETINAWIKLSRLPFHLVGIFPFLLGTYLSYRTYNQFNLPVFAFGLAAVILIMLCTHFGGEYCDIIEDRLTATMEKNAFSGGSQIIAQNVLPHEYANIASHIALLLVIIIGLIIQFYFNTGKWTIPLGIIGLVSGYFYSQMPIRFVAKGVGEILIGFNYGWLPVAVSYYLQSGMIDNIVHWISLPIACTIFNVILINEFPDYPADLISKKNNLVVRLGKEKAAYLYIFMSIASWFTFVLSLKQGLPFYALIFYAPIFLISLFVTVMMIKKGYLNRKLLETMCGLSIVMNLGTVLSYIVAVWLKGF